MKSEPFVCHKIFTACAIVRGARVRWRNFSRVILFGCIRPSFKCGDSSLYWGTLIVSAGHAYDSSKILLKQYFKNDACYTR